MTRVRRTTLSAAVVCILLLAGQAGADEEGIPAGRMAEWDKVRALYHENCAVCHGEEGVPLVPGTPNFAEGERLDKSDAELIKTIREGKDAMPPWRDVLKKDKQEALLRYVRVIAGGQVFEQKCNRCHGLSVPPLPEGVPATEKELLEFQGVLNICREKVETTMTRREILDVIRFLRTLEK